MKSKLYLPMIILVALILAFVFRWTEEAAITKDGVRFIYTKDRWTGEQWVRVHGYIGGTFVSNSIPANLPKGEPQRKEAINKADNIKLVAFLVWLTLFLLCSFWIYTIIKSEKELAKELEGV